MSIGKYSYFRKWRAARDAMRAALAENSVREAFAAADEAYETERDYETEFSESFGVLLAEIYS